MSGGRCRRVVVTGLGAVSPLGAGVEANWSRLLRGDCGIGFVRDEEKYKELGIPTRLAAMVPRLCRTADEVGIKQHCRSVAFDADKVQAVHSRRSLPDTILFALGATDEAMLDAGLSHHSLSTTKSNWDPTRSGVAIGAGISGLQDIIVGHETLTTRGYRRVSPHLIPNSLVNMSAGMVSISYQLQGPNHAVSTACATGAHAIGDAYRFIKYNDADIMVCGGTDACIIPIVVAGFARAKALAMGFEERPLESSRPFDADRNGFVIAEGAAVLVLEELEHAVARNAKVYAEIRGYGKSGDAYHITAPQEDGNGAFRAMSAAIQEGGITPSELDHINAHATSTPLGDGIECTAISKLLGIDASKVTVTSTKGATGHLLGAAGALEAVFTVLSIHHSVAPPTLNLTTPLVQGRNLRLVANAPQQQCIEHSLCNSFGFGGTNVSLLFSKIAPFG